MKISLGMVVMENDEKIDIDILSESLTDEIVGAVGLPKTRLNHNIFRLLFHDVMDRMAAVGVPYNRIVREEGVPAASKWALSLFCHPPKSRGVENIPDNGPLFVISNHPGAYDALCLFTLLGRRDINWVASEIPFLNLLPDTRRHILFSSRKDSSQRMVVFRNIVAHLRQGGTMVYFGSGHRDPDPAVFPGSEASIDGWMNVIDPLYKVVPGLRILPAFVSGIVSEKWAFHPLTRLRKKQIDRHRLAEFGQVISQLMHPGKLYVTPAVSFGKPLSETDLRKGNMDGSLQKAIIHHGKDLYREHIREFACAYP